MKISRIFIIFAFVILTTLINSQSAALFAKGHEHESERSAGKHKNAEAYHHHNLQHPTKNYPLNHPYNRPNYNYGNYGNYGGGGGVVGGYGVNPYPDPNSQPGMSDDSNALYQHELKIRGQGY